MGNLAAQSIGNLLSAQDRYAAAGMGLLQAIGKFTNAKPVGATSSVQDGEQDLLDAAVRVTLSEVGLKASAKVVAIAFRMDEEVLALGEPEGRDQRERKAL